MYYEVEASEELNPVSIINQCVESGAECLLFDAAALPDAFFDLSTGVAGELLHKLSVYRLPMAAVVPDPESHSDHFRSFMREANRGREVGFFASRQEAVDWLEQI
jgi:hypothetical protein